MRWLSVLCAAVVLLGAEYAAAQRTRFPGDSPTRPSVMNGKVLGNPSRRRPNVPTFTIPQGGYGGYSPYGYWGYDPYYYSGGYYSGYPPYYPGVRVVDYRVLYGLPVPQAINNNNDNAAPPRAARPPAAPPADVFPPRPPRPAAAPEDAALKRARRFIEQGDRRLRQEELMEARNRYRRAAKAAPELAEVHFRLMFLEMATGRFEEAATALREGLALEPEWAQSGFNLERVLTDAGQQAVDRLLEQRLREFPNNVDARLLLGVLRHFQGQPVLAAQQFEEVLRTNPRDLVALSFLPEQP